MENPYAAPAAAGTGPTVAEPANATVIEFEDAKLSKRRWRIAYDDAEMVVTDLAEQKQLRMERDSALAQIRFHIPALLVFTSAKSFRKRMLKMPEQVFDEVLRWVGWRKVRQSLVRAQSAGAGWLALILLVNLVFQLAGATRGATDPYGIGMWVACSLAGVSWVVSRCWPGQAALLLNAFCAMIIGAAFVFWALFSRLPWFAIVILFNAILVITALRAHRYFARCEARERRPPT